MPSSNEAGRQILEEHFDRMEQAFLHQEPPADVLNESPAWDLVFASKTQAYREVLLGCLLTRITDSSKDIHLPYVQMGPNSFSGRSLDEGTVNPFLHEKNVPCSGGPYLSVFRRQVRFDAATRQGVKDKAGYDAFLALLDAIAATEDVARLLLVLDHLLHRFIVLREEARIVLMRLERISLEQCRQLIAGLLARQSGGLFPVFLVVGMVETLSERFALNWAADFQGINVADRASGAGGDITVRESGRVILTIEVTERPLDLSRVRATFTEKIMETGASEYVFLVHLAHVDEQAKQQVERYFAQGYDVSVVDMREWLVNSLVMVGARGRHYFLDITMDHLSSGTVPKSLRVWWNEEISKLIGQVS